MTLPANKLTNLQVTATVAAVGALGICIVFLLWRFLPALLWAAVLTIALWPYYARVLRWRRSGLWHRLWAPLFFTILVAVAVAIPIALAALEIAKETHAIMTWIMDAQHAGAPVPAVILQIPWFGLRIAAWWHSNLSDPKAATVLFANIGHTQLFVLSRSLGGEILNRALLFVLSLAVLFFLFRDGQTIGSRLLKLGEVAFGARSALIARQVVLAIHGTVDGLVLAGLAEGAVIGIGYWVTGVPHTVAFTIATCILAIIPFGAPLAFCAAGFLLLGAGHVIAAIGLVIFGFVVVFVTDHVVRPVLIGGAARIPFMLVLLGILGGLSSLGLVGLFVGPAVMAIVMALWNDFSERRAAE